MSARKEARSRRQPVRAPERVRGAVGRRGRAAGAAVPHAGRHRRLPQPRLLRRPRALRAARAAAAPRAAALPAARRRQRGQGAGCVTYIAYL